LSVKLFLLRLNDWKKWLSPLAKKWGPTERPTSPPSEDFGAEVCEHHAAEGAGAVLLNRDDAQA